MCEVVISRGLKYQNTMSVHMIRVHGIKNAPLYISHVVRFLLYFRRKIPKNSFINQTVPCAGPLPAVNKSVGSCVWRKLAILKGWQSSQKTLLTPKILQMLSTCYCTWCHDLRIRQTTSKTTKLTFLYVLFAVHPNMIVFFYQLDAQILCLNPSAWSDGHCPHAARSHSFVYISTS